MPLALKQAHASRVQDPLPAPTGIPQTSASCRSVIRSLRPAFNRRRRRCRCRCLSLVHGRCRYTSPARAAMKLANALHLHQVELSVARLATRHPTLSSKQHVVFLYIYEKNTVQYTDMSWLQVTARRSERRRREPDKDSSDFYQGIFRRLVKTWRF